MDIAHRLAPWNAASSYVCVKLPSGGGYKSALGPEEAVAEVEHLFAQLPEPAPDEVLVAVRVAPERLENIRATVRGVMHEHNDTRRLTLLNV